LESAGSSPFFANDDAVNWKSTKVVPSNIASFDIVLTQDT